MDISFLVYIETNPRKYEPFIISVPEKVNVSELKVKISHVIGLYKYQNDLIFEGMLLNQDDTLLVDQVCKKYPSISKTGNMYPINVVIPDFRIQYITIPHDLIIRTATEFNNFIHEAIDQGMPFDSADIFQRVHRQTVNRMATLKICERETKRASRAKWSVDYILNRFFNPFLRDQNNDIRRMYGFVTRLLIINLLILILVTGHSFDSTTYGSIYWFSVVGGLFFLIISMFWMFFSEYACVVKFYFQNYPMRYPNIQINRPFFLDIHHLLNVVGEFLFTLLPNVRY